ncbi:sex comb on midleg-like protein 4 isoform X2 [Rhineura floridana]|uniref:sex comb on midleg-like protein 4 isoform X2 n=1 Tax=Rhineura floridana TaxID=261503 RepID=UPI002AC7FACD|nr:sex comb on midleg-like protein 4 isoform X2 [Rhineura floridana]
MNHLPSLPPRLDTVDMQSPRIPGRKRGRPPLHSTPMKMAVHNLYSAPAGSLPVVKIPKKRGRKPGYKLKSRVLMTPLAISPPRSTPEPDISSIPQDAATIPNSVAPQALTVSASFDGKQHLLSLPVVNSIGYVLRFLKKLCRSLLCDNLFSNQPFPQYNTSANPEEYENGRMESETVIPEDYLVDPVTTKHYSVDPSDSAFNCMGSVYSMRQSSGDGRHGGGSSSSCSHRSGQMASGGPPTTGLRHQTSSPTRNGTYMEGNRSASSPSPERQDAARPISKNPLTWTVDDVVWFVKDADPHALGPHVELFRKHEIDGNALLLLKSDMIMKYLGLKLGPALKLCYHIDKLKQTKF